MQAKVLGWSLEQISELVSLVNEKGDKSLREVFDDYARKHKRNLYSVRNFYYFLIREAERNYKVRELLINNEIKLGYTNHFGKEEERTVLKTILIDNKKSVRATCLMLANGDKKLAIRYQNKYRNSLKSNAKVIRYLVEEIQDSGQKCRINSGGKILQIPRAKSNLNYVSEDEIRALFLGLVRMVKRSAEQELENKQNLQIKMEANKLNEIKIDNSKKMILIQELKAQNESLKTQLGKAQEEQQKSREMYQRINDFVRDNKMEKLRDFVSKLSKNEQKTSKKR